MMFDIDDFVQLNKWLNANPFLGALIIIGIYGTLGYIIYSSYRRYKRKK